MAGSKRLKPIPWGSEEIHRAPVRFEVIRFVGAVPCRRHKVTNFVKVLENAVPDLGDSKLHEPEAEKLPHLAPSHPSDRVRDPE